MAAGVGSASRRSGRRSATTRCCVELADGEGAAIPMCARSSHRLSNAAALPPARGGVRLSLADDVAFDEILDQRRTAAGPSATCGSAARRGRSRRASGRWPSISRGNFGRCVNAPCRCASIAPAKPSARPSSAPLRRRPPDARKGLAQEALEGAIDEPLVAGGKLRVAEAEFSSPPGAEGMALTPGRRPLSAISSAASNAHMNWLLSLPIRHGFLALQFGSVEVEHLANEHIRPVVKKELGYELLGLREVSKAGVIDEILCETIRKSEFMIADLTDGNNGVYWEAGFAEGARIPVIYICERSKFEAKKTHFDTNHRTTIMWSSGESDPFEGKLVDTIRRTVEQGSHRES